MDAVIMAGGRGVRFRPFTEYRPKPMIPFLNRPVMEYIITKLRKAGINRIKVLLGHLPNKIKEHFGDGKAFGINIEYIHGNVPFGTSGAVKRAMAQSRNPFLVASADIVTEISFKEFIRFSEEKGGIMNIALSNVENPYQYGIALVDERDRIYRFLEKPKKSKIFSNLVNTGIYVVDPKVLKLVPPNTKFDFSKDLIPKLLKKSQPVYGYKSSKYWRDIGTPKGYLAATRDVIEGRINLEMISGEMEMSEDKGLILGKNCIVADDVNVNGFAVLGNNVNVKKGTKLLNTIIWSDTYVGKNVSIKDSIVGENVTIFSNVKIESNMIPDNQWVISDR